MLKAFIGFWIIIVSLFTFLYIMHLIEILHKKFKKFGLKLLKSDYCSSNGHAYNGKSNLCMNCGLYLKRK
jgi:hypothetical protein